MANIIPRSPFFGRMSRLSPFNDLDDWFNNFGMRPYMAEMDAGPLIKVDLSENDQAYTLRAEVPGVKKEDIKVSVDGSLVTISAETRKEKEEKEGEKVICSERYHGVSYRTIGLECDVDEGKSEAKYENGMLELKLPKKSGSRSKQLMVM